MRACHAESNTYIRSKDIHKYTCEAFSRTHCSQFFVVVEHWSQPRPGRERKRAYDYIYLKINSIWLNWLFMRLVVTRQCHVILYNFKFAIGFRLMLHRKCMLEACLFIVFFVLLKVDFLAIELANNKHVIVIRSLTICFVWLLRL